MKLLSAILMVLALGQACLGQIVYGPMWYDAADGTYMYPQNNSNVKLYDGGYLDTSQTVNQSTYPSVNASQTASTLQDGSAYTGTDATMSTQYIAVKFVASAAHTMGDFTICVKESADLTNTTGVITGYIYADDGGTPSKPTGSALATGLSVKFGTITSTYQVLSVGTTYTMVSGTAYWLVLKYSETPTGGNIALDSDVSSNMGATSADGSSWTNTNVRLRYAIRGLTGRGLYGSSTNNYGVYGNSTNSHGMWGISTNSYGIRGSSTNSYGCYGASTNSAGCVGSSTSSVGVRGTSINNYSGYFSRNTETPSGAVPVFYVLQDHASDTQDALRVKQDSTGSIYSGYGSGAAEVFKVGYDGTVYTPKITSLATNGNITILPNGTGITVIGDAGSTALSLNTNDDLLVTGRVEIQGATFVRRATFSTNMNTDVAGTAGEIVYCTTDSKAYVCTTTGAAGAAVWAALN